MAQTGIAALAIAILVLLSVRADRRFAGLRRLPMQWSLIGVPTWTAPRRIGLAFTPVLAALVLAAAVAGTVFLTPRPGQEGLEGPVVAILGAGFVAIHAFHLWLIDRTTRDRR